jgi:hypothetical protein
VVSHTEMKFCILNCIYSILLVHRQEVHFCTPDDALTSSAKYIEFYGGDPSGDF